MQHTICFTLTMTCFWIFFLILWIENMSSTLYYLCKYLLAQRYNTVGPWKVVGDRLNLDILCVFRCFHWWVISGRDFPGWLTTGDPALLNRPGLSQKFSSADTCVTSSKHQPYWCNCGNMIRYPRQHDQISSVTWSDILGNMIRYPLQHDQISSATWSDILCNMIRYSLRSLKITHQVYN